MKVLYVYADSPREWNCSEWNCIIPTKAINRIEGNSASAVYIQQWLSNSQEMQELTINSDIVVVERNYFGDTHTMINYWKVRNKTIMAIFDDAYDIMHPKNVSYRFWTFGELKIKNEEGKEQIVFMKPPPIEQFRWGMRTVKGIQVPSVNLARDWGRYNRSFFVHNYLDIEKYKDVVPLHEKQKGDIVIGWCGSLSHYASFHDSGVFDALKQVCKKHKNVKVLISGDKRMFDRLEVDRKMFQPFVPPEQWCPLVKSLDIGLAPLAGEYDKRRSWIKVLEYMALKVPWIATNYPTYDELHDYGIITENGGRYWVNSIEKMLDEYKDWEEKANTTGYEFALQQSSDIGVKNVTLPLYEKMINAPYPEFTPVQDEYKIAY